MQSQVPKPKVTMYCGLCTREIPEQEFADDEVIVTLVGSRYRFVQRVCYEMKKSDNRVFEGEGAV